MNLQNGVIEDKTQIVGTTAERTKIVEHFEKQGYYAFNNVMRAGVYTGVVSNVPNWFAAQAWKNAKGQGMILNIACTLTDAGGKSAEYGFETGKSRFSVSKDNLMLLAENVRFTVTINEKGYISKFETGAVSEDEKLTKQQFKAKYLKDNKLTQSDLDGSEVAEATFDTAYEAYKASTAVTA